MSTRGPFNYSIDRMFVDPVYDNNSKLINYTMKHDYSLLSSPADQDVNMNIT